jgi:uncharacterized protein with HEPN domain
MSRHDSGIILRQILQHAEEIRELIAGAQTSRLEENRLLELAVLRLLEMIGEAVTRLPPEVTEQHREIPWAQIVGLRNRLIHGYDSVDLEIVERVLEDDLPALIGQLRGIPGVSG